MWDESVFYIKYDFGHLFKIFVFNIIILIPMSLLHLLRWPPWLHRCGEGEGGVTWSFMSVYCRFSGLHVLPTTILTFGLYVVAIFLASFILLVISLIETLSFNLISNTDRNIEFWVTWNSFVISSFNVPVWALYVGVYILLTCSKLLFCGLIHGSIQLRFFSLLLCSPVLARD